MGERKMKDEISPEQKIANNKYICGHLRMLIKAMRPNSSGFYARALDNDMFEFGTKEPELKNTVHVGIAYYLIKGRHD